MTTTNPGATEYWNGDGGRRWVHHEAQYDAMLAPINSPLLAAATLTPGMRVIDVGCGFGAATEAVAEAIAPGGTVIGVDLSVPLLGRARARSAERVAAGRPGAGYEVADAQVADLVAVAGGPVDRVMSRFGVMFFDDPVVAFTNIGRALAPDGRLAMAVWQAIDRNPWMGVAGKALTEGHGVAFVGPPEGPGPYALADRDRIEAVLASAGFASMAIEDVRTPLRVAGGADAAGAAEHLVDSVTQFLPADVEPAPRNERVRLITDALAVHDGPDGVVLDSAVWIVTAAYGLAR